MNILLRVPKNTSSVSALGTLFVPDANGNIEVDEHSPESVVLRNTMGFLTPEDQDAVDAAASAEFTSRVVEAMNKARAV
jgi:hypothetical protein